MRAALYARYSDAKQNPRSVQDQLDLCARHAASRGWEVVASFQDAHISGAATANRPGLLAAIAAAQAGDYDILLAEAEDRISRNLGQLATLREDLEAAGVTLATLHTDDVGLMHVAVTGLIAQQYLVDLGRKTARGMAANAERGLATGSRLYGYRSQPGGALAIVEEEAAIVRRIFAEYAEGRSGKAIAGRLNADAVPGPRGGAWTTASILGSRSRGNGVLHSEIYAGVKVYGRMKVIKDPRTGRRTPRLKPPEQWQRLPVPHLAILEPETWKAAQARLAEQAPNDGLRAIRRRPPRIFSGLWRCGCCGGPYTVAMADRLACATRKQQGLQACSNGLTLNAPRAERRVLQGLKDRLLEPEAVAAYVRAYHLAWNEEARAAAKARAAAEGPRRRRRAELERSIDRLVDAVANGSDSPALQKRLADQERELSELTKVTAAAGETDANPPAPPIAFHPKAAEAFAHQVQRLQECLEQATASEEPADQDLVQSIRSLVNRIEVIPLEPGVRGGAVDFRLHGELARVVADRPPLPAGRGYQSSPGTPTLVAGASYSRPPASYPVEFILRAS